MLSIVSVVLVQIQVGGKTWGPDKRQDITKNELNTKAQKEKFLTHLKH